MKSDSHLNVAVLLATYDGCNFVKSQIFSLRDNATPFTLHWIDDHSTDNTAEAVRVAAREAGIPLMEWQHPLHLGVPGSYFWLLERVDADIYLFCDQDDIWQPGKIDAIAENLSGDISAPVLCSSDLLEFENDNPKTAVLLSERLGSRRVWKAQQRPPIFLIFMHALSSAQTQGFTKALRQIFLGHKEIASKFASLHDSWMYDVAIASGVARLLRDVPTALRRLHPASASRSFIGQGRFLITQRWRTVQTFRRLAARHAQGFIYAAPTLPEGAELNRLLGLAALVSKIDRRQTLREMMKLFRVNALPWWGPQFEFLFSIACLVTHANPDGSNSGHCLTKV